jgi:hypothetical protein
MESLKKFRSFEYGDYLYVDGRTILVDEPLSNEKRNDLMSLATVDGKSLVFIDTANLAVKLEVFLQEIASQESEVLFVFPGNGANYPRALSTVCKQVCSASVFAKRVWSPGIEPYAIANHILPEAFLHLRVGTIVVVDDVISSGKTMNKLHQNNAWRFPKAKWIGACWLSQVPQMKADSGVNGYSRVVTACVVEGQPGKKVPINSLSTLRNEPAIAQIYAKRHFSDADAFLRLIS